jgi:hypothetical protein
MAKVERVRAVQKALRKVREKKQKQLKIGLLRAGFALQRWSQKVVPVDTGALKSSASTRPDMIFGPSKPSVIVSYGTNYGLFVHENLNATHKKGKQAKFLSGPARQYKERLVEIVRAAFKDKGKH